MSPVKLFNKALKTLITDLLSTFPDILEIKLLQASFYVLKKLNKKLPCKFFHKYVMPYNQHLLDKDESFFLSDKFQSSFWPSFVNMIKSTWATLDQHNKDAIWNHLHVIMHLHNTVYSVETFDDVDDSCLPSGSNL